jgi:hypothetical protein
MDEVDAYVIDLGTELGEGVEPILRRRPVVRVGLVTAEVLQIRQWHTLGPVREGLFLRHPACVMRYRRSPSIVTWLVGRAFDVACAPPKPHRATAPSMALVAVDALLAVVHPAGTHLGLTS